MKNRTKAIIILACALGVTVPLAACTINAAPYDDFGEIVKIVYHRNGGIFSGNRGVEITDSIPVSAFRNGGVLLLAPGDAKRDEGSSGNNTASASTIARSGYTLTGWYRECEYEARVNEDGEALDDWGEPIKTSGKEQGNLYSGRWDYEGGELLTLEDLVGMEEYDENGNPTGSYVFHLYAAWAPVYTYTFYRETTEEEKREAASRGETIGDWIEYGTAPVSNNSIAIPEWDVPGTGATEEEKAEATGELVFATNFRRPTFTNAAGDTLQYTLTGVYGDPEKKIVYADYSDNNTDTAQVKSVEHHGFTNTDGDATTVNATVALYTTWKPGRWVKVIHANQLSNAADTEGCYIIRDDLDFEDITWNFGGRVFSGSFFGNGYTIKNIVSTQNNIDQLHFGGVFGEVTESADIHNVTFENVLFNLTVGTNKTGGFYGLFAGTLSAAATIDDVRISGTINVGGRDTRRLVPSTLTTSAVGSPTPQPGDYIKLYDIGLVSGNRVTGNISSENIKTDAVTVEYDLDNHPYEYAKIYDPRVQQDGSVRIYIVNPEDYVIFYTVTLRQNGAGNGNTATLSETEVEGGTEATLTVKAAEGYTYTVLIDGEEQTLNGTGIYTFTVEKNVTVTVTFTKVE